MSHRRDLIFDVGVCNGDDSAYYLHKGFKVVGVEANPLLIPRLQERFAAEIGDGRYHLMAMGIAAAEGQAEFWVCDDRPEWSSFDRSIASRNGARHHSVTIATCRFGALLERFGTPHYCKIDIEGNDDLCLVDMAPKTAPKFVSVEVIDPARQLRLLGSLGYDRFKLISQRTLRQPSMALARLKAILARIGPASRLFTTAEARLGRRRFDGEWRFRGGSSGPFGENTSGTWLTADQALDLSRTLERRKELWDWFDIHAAR